MSSAFVLIASRANTFSWLQLFFNCTLRQGWCARIVCTARNFTSERNISEKNTLLVILCDIRKENLRPLNVIRKRCHVNLPVDTLNNFQNSKYVKLVSWRKLRNSREVDINWKKHKSMLIYSVDHQEIFYRRVEDVYVLRHSQNILRIKCTV